MYLQGLIAAIHDTYYCKKFSVSFILDILYKVVEVNHDQHIICYSNHSVFILNESDSKYAYFSCDSTVCLDYMQQRGN